MVDAERMNHVHLRWRLRRIFFLDDAKLGFLDRIDRPRSFFSRSDDWEVWKSWGRDFGMCSSFFLLPCAARVEVVVMGSLKGDDWADISREIKNL